MDQRKSGFFGLGLRARLALCALLALVGASCAEERAPINRVQANALKKSFFVGDDLADTKDNPEFYYRPTIVDVDYGAAQDGLFTASYAQTTARINWEITQDLLLARLTYERIPGSTGNGTPDANAGVSNTGQIAAAFKIESHFDIKRAYNPQTGEELNIIEENTADRAWYQRDFMRVDWSQNLITSAYQLDTLAAIRSVDDSIHYEPVAYYVADPADPDAPVFDADSGYFDITNKVFATPQMLDTPFGPIPACLLSPDFFGGSGPVGNCNPTEIKVRLSFRRVGDHDFEPVNWDGSRMDMFGLFTTGTLNPDRLGYDRNYGVVDDRWYRFASRHNIWAQSHALGSDGQPIACFTSATTPIGAEPTRDFLTPNASGGFDPSPDGTDDECEAAGPGSRCDRFSHACTLPYVSRSTRANPFYYGPESDPTLFDSSARALAEWDGAMRQTVQAARYTECMRTQGGVATAVIAACKTRYPPDMAAALAAVPPIFMLCHNPVIQGDDAACGKPGTLARIGDLRYHMANIIQKPQTPSPWGILADAVDPVTGEVIAASVNVWNYVTDVATQSTVDMMRWYLGELSNQQVEQAQYLSSLVNAQSRYTLQGSASPPLMADSEISARLAGLDARLDDGTQVLPPDGLSSQAQTDWLEAQVRQKYGDRVLGSGNTGINTRLTQARGSPVESALLTAPYLRLAGLDPSAPSDDLTTQLASPLRANFAQFRVDFERERQLRLSQNGACMLEAPEPTSVIGWAKIMNGKFPLPAQASPADVQARNAKWQEYIRQRLNFGVLAHELGHSMGLRHQFTSSFDALNYRPQYWQLRTRDGQETTACTTATSDGTSCIGPRWLDPVTDAEAGGLIWRWQQTSVMDYPGDLTQESVGIGAYDRAAIRLAYADVADVWDDAGISCSTALNGTCNERARVLARLHDGFGGLTGPFYFGNQNAFHYSQLNANLNLISNCQPADTSAPPGWDADKDGVYSPELDGQIVNGTTCSGIPTDFVPYRELMPLANSASGAVFTQEPPIGVGVLREIDALGRVRRPYMFGSDEYADIGNLPVLRSDNGADAYEVTHFLTSEYEDRHIFDNYRRNRTTFSLRNAFMRSFGRYNSKLMEVTKGFALLNEIYRGTGIFERATLNDFDLKAGALASSLVFDHFARMLTRPSSGDHYSDQALSPMGDAILRSTDQLPTNNNTQVPSPVLLAVPDGSTGIGVDMAFGGRPLHNALDTTKGYYVTQYDAWVGSYYDKTIASYLMTDSQDRFISQSRDDFQDGRYRNTSFATLFPDGVRRLIANSLTEDQAILGWRVASTGGTPNVDASRAPTRPMGFRVWWSKNAPDVCWPFQGRLNCQEFPSGNLVSQGVPAESVALDPEVGFEVQKFVAFFSMLNLPESWKLDYVDMFRIWQIGADASPSFPPSETVAWRDPQSGELFVAHSYGTEQLDGKTIQRGIAARVLEWMNVLTTAGYQVASTDPVTGEQTVARYPDDSGCPTGVSSCNGQPVQADARFALRVTNYKSVLDFMRSTAAQLGFYGPNWRGIY